MRLLEKDDAEARRADLLAQYEGELEALAGSTEPLPLGKVRDLQIRALTLRALLAGDDVKTYLGSMQEVAKLGGFYVEKKVIRTKVAEDEEERTAAAAWRRELEEMRSAEQEE